MLEIDQTSKTITSFSALSVLQRLHVAMIVYDTNLHIVLLVL